eukprot:CAMPEP_0114496172 /NCGR_PEP_ID=MMETSP0109-20121206/5624_1 /TAXON_ID=29199 /ORGANISM="Chlorarachnion reptans, Strain CCCM449" /LENGTH=156 /DNA_ID=CAMNT_0001673419 /DNA_START=57 /DNA_END=524 /DNA_ORIENTATION=-
MDVPPKCTLREYLSGVLVEKAMRAFEKAVDPYVKDRLKKAFETPLMKQQQFQEMMECMQKRLEDIKTTAEKMRLELKTKIKECKDAKWPESFAPHQSLRFLVAADETKSLPSSSLLEEVEKAVAGMKKLTGKNNANFDKLILGNKREELLSLTCLQ